MTPISAAEITAAWTLYSPARRWGFLAILFLVSMSNYVDRLVMSILLEPIKLEFGATDAMMGLLTGFAFAACYAVLGIPVARWSDRGDRRLVITVSLSLWSVATVLCGFAPSFALLALARAAVGIGEAGAVPPAQSLIADYFPPEQRTRAFAIFILSSTAAYLVAFTVGSRLAAAHGWRSAFIVFGLPGLLLAAVTLVGLREPRRRRGQAATAATTEPLAATFRALARKRSYVLMTVAIVFYFLVAYGALTWLPAYLVRVLHVSLVEVGQTYGPLGAVAALVGSLAGGTLTDLLAGRDARRLAILPGLILIVACPDYEAGLLLDDVVWVYAALFAGGVALGAALPATFSALHLVCGSPRRSMAIAITFFFSNLLGLGFGPLITGALSDFFTARYGQTGLRYALMPAFAMLLPAGATAYAASKTIARDVES